MFNFALLGKARHIALYLTKIQLRFARENYKRPLRWKWPAHHLRLVTRTFEFVNISNPCGLWFFFFFISWRLITLQYCSGFVIHWQESAMVLHVFPVPIPPPTSLSTWSLWDFPVHQVWALVSCIQPGLVICFTQDNIHVSMLFSWNIPPLPSPTESKRDTSVSLFLFCL